MPEMEALGYILVGGLIFVFINFIFDVSSFFINLKCDYKLYVYILYDYLGNVKYITNNPKDLLKNIKYIRKDSYIEIIKYNEVYYTLKGNDLYKQLRCFISPIQRLKNFFKTKVLSKY